eukprot:207413-Hanusia_phi.AAC.1
MIAARCQSDTAIDPESETRRAHRPGPAAGPGAGPGPRALPRRRTLGSSADRLYYASDDHPRDHGSLRTDS